MILKKCDLDHFTKCGQFSNISPHLKKTDANREKLIKEKANNRTPQACFFIRNLRTPKINLAIDLFSMVERKGQRLGVGCFPFEAVCHPFTLYRQTVTSLAESLRKYQKETAKMLYKFLLLGEKRLHLTILADSEQQAEIKQLNHIDCNVSEFPISPDHPFNKGEGWVKSSGKWLGLPTGELCVIAITVFLPFFSTLGGAYV